MTEIKSKPFSLAPEDWVYPSQPLDIGTSETKGAVEIVQDLLTLIYAYQGSMAQFGIRWLEQSPSVERAEVWLEEARRTFNAPPSAQ